MEQISSVIGSAYDAALDPALWPDAVEQACRLLDCFQGAIGAFDFLQEGANLQIQWGYEPHYWQSFLDHYHRTNPAIPTVLRSKTGEVYSFGTAGDDFDYEAFYASAHYKEWVEPQGQVDAVWVTLDKTGWGIAALTCVRHQSVGFASETELRRMRLIAPHFRRAILIGKVIDLHKVEAAAFAETIGGLATAVFMVNALGGLVHANPSGEAMLAAEDPVRLAQGALTAIDQRAQGALASVFAAASSGDAAMETGGVAVPLVGKGGDHFTAHVLPLTAGARRQAGASFAAVAALFVRNATIDLSAAIGAATQLYGFTPTEVRVLRAVIEVGGVEPVASMLGMSKWTAKTHLASLFEKTGARRQAELVKLIAGFDNPVRPPRKR